ncbi:MAG: hypothetical protein Q9219_001182 [cf. Caloplaca sp. 3 TL-2023]
MAVVHGTKRRKLSPPDSPSAGSSEESSTQNRHLERVTGWNIEQNYEQRLRKSRHVEESTRLPIKTADGRIEKATVILEQQEDTEESFFGSGSENEDAIEETGNKGGPAEISVQQQVLEAREELARIGTLLSESPEEHTGGFKRLADMAASTNPTIKKLALATQLAVYKDLIPGYRIRPLGEAEGNDKISKDVQRLRSFEQSLVSNYHNYVKELAKSVKGSGNGASMANSSISAVATSCTCTLLLAVPHFNFRSELIEILVNKLGSRNQDNEFSKSLETLEKLFQDDEDGNPSLDGVTQLAKMMKARNYQVDESVLNTFLHLRLLSELSSRASQNRVDKHREDGKKPKSKKQFRTKRERKLLKERKSVEKEFKEADAIVSHEEQERLQSETLKMVFVAYFRILKARIPSLTGAVLEGLAKYAHLINQDFFGDLLEALKDLISNSADLPGKEEEQAVMEDASTTTHSPPSTHNSVRSSLLCTTTAFALLEGQDVSRSASSLSLDLTFFTAHLYRSLHAYALNPDIELSAKSLRLPDPYLPPSPSPAPPISPKINLQTPSVLLLRALSSILLPRTVPPLRVAAFVKQLYICALHMPERSARAVLGLLEQVVKVHGRKVAGLWDTEERKGDGAFDARRGDVEGSNPFAGTVWEGELLRCHYVPKVREGVRAVEKVVGGVR